MRTLAPRYQAAALAVILAAATVLPASATSLFVAPAGCEGFLTVQLKNCQVANYYRCATDNPGDTWSTYLDSQGAHYTSRIDSETRWVQSFDHIDAVWDYLDEDAPDHASFTALIESGRDDFEFSTTDETGETRRYKGHDRLTGQTVLLDGVTLERTEFDLTAMDADGNFLHRRTGNQYISREWRVFFSDTDHFENAFGDKIDSVDTPVDFVFPGQPGFFTTEPKYGCDMLMTDVPSQIVPAKAVQP